MELRITSEKIMQVAEKFPEHVNFLKSIFPEAFPSFKNPSNKENLFVKDYPQAICFNLAGHSDNSIITAYRECQGYEGFVLSQSYDWQLKKVNGSLQLIPTHKK